MDFILFKHRRYYLAVRIEQIEQIKKSGISDKEPIASQELLFDSDSSGLLICLKSGFKLPVSELIDLAKVNTDLIELSPFLKRCFYSEIISGFFIYNNKVFSVLHEKFLTGGYK